MSRPGARIVVGVVLVGQTVRTVRYNDVGKILQALFLLAGGFLAASSLLRSLSRLQMPSDLDEYTRPGNCCGPVVVRTSAQRPSTM